MADTASSKSRTEIAAAGNLRKLYDALLSDAAATATCAQPPTQWEALTPSRRHSRPQSARSPTPNAVVCGPGSASAAGFANVGVDAIRPLRRQRYTREQQEQQSGDVGTPTSATTTTKSPSKVHGTRKNRRAVTDAACFAAWLSLSTTVFALKTDLTTLDCEIRASELRCTELQERHRLVTDTDTLSPKLQCLARVLGEHDFRRYLHDLSVETAAFRRHFGLYNRRFQRLQQRVWEVHDKSVTGDACLDMLNSVVAADLTKHFACEDERTQGTTKPAEQSLVSRYPVLFQHCADSRDSNRVVLPDLIALLEALPTSREALVRRVFEQISDVRRGEGTKPPPDVVRPHKLTALTKQSLANGLCSRVEFDEVARWLASPLHYDLGIGSVSSQTGVSLRSFLAFHTRKSDTFSAEDAEFVTYLVRVWSFQVAVPSSGPAVADVGPATVYEVLKSYELRCQLTASNARKNELVAKIHSALEKNVTKRQILEAHVLALQTLHLNDSSVWRSVLNDARLSAQCAVSLTLLKELVLSRQCLETLPAFIVGLMQLQVLDLSDNLLSTLPWELEQLQELHVLVLSANRLTDKSFQSLETAFAKLTALRDLQLRGNQLTTLPRAITALTALTALDVSANRLRSLPSAVVKLWDGKCQLATLDLHQNALTSLPDEIVVMRATLRHLFLHENKLRALPTAVSLLSRLEQFTLSRNALGLDFTMYPATMTQHRVQLDHNQLRIFPVMEHAVKMYLEGTPSSVVSVNVSWNRLESVPPEVFGRAIFSECEVLELHHNKLRELPDELFHALPALRVCKLSCNRLTRLPDSITTCTSLQVLDVQQNRLIALSPGLVALERLAVLNATENELTDVPSEWHAFASFGDSDGKRTLQTLALKKNPLENKMLRTLVNGSSLDASTAALASARPNDEQASEFTVKKVVDALHTAIDVLAMETDDDDDVELDTAETVARRSRWKGVTRNVNRYLERKLRTIHAAERSTRSSDADNSALAALSPLERDLYVSARGFQRLLKALPSMCSQHELVSLVMQFRVPSAGLNDTTVSGYQFLVAIDQFGQRRTLSTAPAPSNSSFAISRPTDPVASILYYLSVAESQRTRKQSQATDSLKKETRKRSERSAASFIQRNRANAGKRAPLERQQQRDASNSPRRHRSSDENEKIATRELRAQQRFLQRHLDPERDVVMRRQKQRIAVLEQQLMDQKLLVLSRSSCRREANAGAGRRASGSSIHDMEADDDFTSEEEETRREDDAGSVVLVCVKCARGQEDAPQLRFWKSGEPLRFMISVDALVSAVKHRIERETQVPVASQVLVATRANTGGNPASTSVRVRNNACVKEYLEIVSSGGRRQWTVTLLFSESIC